MRCETRAAPWTTTRERPLMSDTNVKGVVVGGTGGVWQIRIDGGLTVDAAMRGRLKKSNSGKRADGSLRRDTVLAASASLKLAVGDDVHLERGDRDDAWAISEILPRRSRLA